MIDLYLEVLRATQPPSRRVMDNHVPASIPITERPLVRGRFVELVEHVHEALDALGWQLTWAQP